MAISPRAGLSSGWLGVYRAGKNGGGCGSLREKFNLQPSVVCKLLA